MQIKHPMINPMDKILVYGFGPYEGESTNITETIVRSLPPSPLRDVIVFPASFKAIEYLQPIKEHQYRAIIGLGQYKNGQQIRIERKAKNQWRTRRGDRMKRILRHGPAVYRPTLLLSAGGEYVYSYDAGTYACNFSMYVLLDYLRGTPVRYGFLHVPSTMKTNKATYELHRVITHVTERSY